VSDIEQRLDTIERRLDALEAHEKRREERRVARKARDMADALRGPERDHNLRTRRKFRDE
jgi:hypothetical protein